MLKYIGMQQRKCALIPIENSVSKVCTRCILPSTFPRIEFDSEGVCSVCRDYDRRWGKMSSTKLERRRILQKICRQAKNKHKEFDALPHFLQSLTGRHEI